MLLACLGPTRRHGPDRGPAVYVMPRHRAYLARPCCGQDREGERPRCDPFTLRQLGHEGGDFAPVEGRMVPDPLPLAGPEKKLVEVAAPARRVLSGPGTHRGRVVQDSRDPLA